MRTPLRTFILSAFSLAILGGCAVGVTPPSRYYLLASDPGLAPSDGIRAAKDLAVAIGPVTVPSYLDRIEIVINRTPYKLELAEFDTWAEPLDENLARVLVEDVSRLLGTDHVLTFSELRGAPVDFEVAVDVEQMGASGGAAILVARWTLIRSRSREHLLTRRSRFSTPLGDTGFETLVEGLSRNVGELSREIAVSIGQLAPTAARS